MEDIKSNLSSVIDGIEKARAKRGSGEPVTLVAVTKNHGVDAMREAIDSGVSAIGENRVQEAAKKFDVLSREVIWHLIGHLQTNKARQAVKMFELIHSVDSFHLMSAIDEEAGKINKIQNILIQVNLAREESKYGIHSEELPDLIKSSKDMSNIHLVGLMCIAPNFEDPEKCRPLFRQMRGIFEDVKNKNGSDIRFLSMGMTGDYKIAIEEGANIVRIGTAIFGAREY